MLPKEQFISLIATDLRDQIQTLSSNDDFIKGIIKCLKERLTPPLRTALSDWTLDDGIILFKNKVFVPNNKDIRRSIIAETHESPVSGHPGHLKTLYLLKERFYWPGMAIMTKQFIDGCAVCQQMKTNTHPTAAPLMPIKSHAHRPFQQVTMDFITDLPISNGFDSIFIVVDQGLSKGVILCPCNKTIDAEGTIKLYIDNVFIQYGLPDVIISDRGPQFASNVFNGIFDAIGVKHRMSTDPLRQDLPRSITPDTGTNGAETTRTMASIPDVLRDEIDRQPLRPIPLRQTQTCNQSFSNLRSSQEIHDRINYIAAFAGLTIAHDDQHRLARLWSLLKDDRFAIAVTQRARGLFNWQCADLIEIFINIAKLEWNEPLCPGTSIEQFGLDLLRHILAADVERLYDASIDDVRANQYGVIPKNENPMDLIYMKYTHPLTIIAPDRSHTIELINNIQDKTNDLAYYINKLSDLAKTIQRNTKWTKRSTLEEQSLKRLQEKSYLISSISLLM
jgi:hypothetical protein